MPGNERKIFVVIFKSKEGRESALNYYMNGGNSDFKIARDISELK